MKGKKGQALVEFIIILPILIIIILGIVDFGLIIYKKNVLEDILSSSSKIYLETKNKEKVEECIKKESKNLVLNWIQENEYITIDITENYDFLTPGLNLIFGDKYKIEAKRVIYNG